MASNNTKKSVDRKSAQKITDTSKMKDNKRRPMDISQSTTSTTAKPSMDKLPEKEWLTMDEDSTLDHCVAFLKERRFYNDFAEVFIELYKMDESERPEDPLNYMLMSLIRNSPQMKKFQAMFTSFTQRLNDLKSEKRKLLREIREHELKAAEQHDTLEDELLDFDHRLPLLSTTVSNASSKYELDTDAAELEVPEFQLKEKEVPQAEAEPAKEKEILQAEAEPAKEKEDLQADAELAKEKEVTEIQKSRVSIEKPETNASKTKEIKPETIKVVKKNTEDDYEGDDESDE